MDEARIKAWEQHLFNHGLDVVTVESQYSSGYRLRLKSVKHPKAVVVTTGPHTPMTGRRVTFPVKPGFLMPVDVYRSRGGASTSFGKHSKEDWEALIARLAGTNALVLTGMMFTIDKDQVLQEFRLKPEPPVQPVSMDF